MFMSIPGFGRLRRRFALHHRLNAYHAEMAVGCASDFSRRSHRFNSGNVGRYTPYDQRQQPSPNGRMIEKAITYIIGGTVAAVLLAAVLPKLIPAAAFIFVMAVILRFVWWYTR